jgi:hypothetical protein
MTKVVINRCHGGFGLSQDALEEYMKRTQTNEETCGWDIARTDPHLIAIVEDMGAQASDRYSQLRVVEIPEDVDWYIEDYDGLEWIAERHRTWS